jgi:phytanoyl-CoA hydroxylase
MADSKLSSALLDDKKLIQYKELGYFTVEGLFTMDLVESIRKEITKVVDRHPDVPPELVQIEPSVVRGEFTPETKELGVRKLFRMAKHNELFKQLAFHPKMVAIAKMLVGSDVKLLQSMLLMKPPYFGGPKVWHQDNAYFRLTPNDVFGFWVACDDASIENGCMHLVPGSHKNGIAIHGGVNDDYGLLNPPDLGQAVAIPLKTGDALIFHGELFHYTPPNTTPRRRRAVQYHYASSKCRVSDEKKSNLKGEVLVAGQEYEGCI